MSHQTPTDVRKCAVPWLAAAALLLPIAHGLAAEPPPLPPLTTVSGSPRLPGKFVWADLVTDDVRAAQSFYARLFGWTFRDQGGYVIAANDERPLCGMFQRPRPKDQTAQPRWFGYLSVPSVERAQRAVTSSMTRERTAVKPDKKTTGRTKSTVRLG